MSHTRKHVITQYVMPMFSDPGVREALSTRQCTKIDAMASQEDFSDKDVRYLMRAIANILED